MDLPKILISYYKNIKQFSPLLKTRKFTNSTQFSLELNPIKG